METNEKVKKNGMLKVIIPLILIVTIVILAGFAYARYVTRISGQSTADIAQWSFKVNDKTNESFTIDLADTRIKANDEVQMQDGYIGPGTSGAFDIRLDATGSEVSLKYDVNIDVDNVNNTKLPKNLVFYSDSDMQNAIYHENNIINLNGFIGVADNSKVHTKTVYWKWAYETGQTQSEINTNDGLDSYWMGKDISIAINVIGKQVNENPTAGEYTVTFDANGGTLQGYGNSSKATKQVTYGENYGELPTPTRVGYTFAGWNGKNLYNFGTVNDYTVAEGRSFNIDTNEKSISIIKTNSWAGDYWRNELNRYEPGTYTLSANFSGDSSPRHIIFTYDENGNIMDNTNLNISGVEWNNYYQGWSISSQTKTVIIPSSVSYWKYGSSFTGVAGTFAKIANIQLEQGTIATEYEPYKIITATDIVNTASNHTLTARWTKNQ